jgi:hypothetical protein
MAEAVLRKVISSNPHASNQVLDRIFFTVMTLVLWAIILFGFAKTYFLAGMVRAPLPNLLIHLHGAAFTLWMILLLVQTTLISTRKVKIHRTLGMITFGLAVLMVVLGVLSGIDAMRRGTAPLGLDAQTFAVISLSDMVCFSALVFLAYRTRFQAELHKRFILISSFALMGAGVGRWPIHFLQTHPQAQIGVPLVLLLALAGFDLLQLHRVSRATLFGGGGLLIVHLVRVPIGLTPAWHAFTSYLLRH